MINAAERGRDVTVTGSAEAGSTVQLDWNGISKTVTVDSSGKWSVAFSNSEIPNDGHTTISASTTNAIGMVSAATTRTVTVDTIAPAQPTLDPVTGDNRITAAEKAAGVTLTGNAEPNSTVDVYWLGIERASTKSVTTDAAGRWSATFTDGEIPEGNTAIDLIATDRAGNASTVSIWEDVVVGALFTGGVIDTVSGDDQVNKNEKNAGVTVSGRAEAGSTVALTWGDSLKQVTTDSSGKWAVPFAHNEVPADGNYTITATITDQVGNVATNHRTVVVDTVGPGAPRIDPVTGDNRITSAERAAGVTVSGISESDGTVRVWIMRSMDRSVVEKAVTVDSAGQWSALFSSSELPVDLSGEIAVLAINFDRAGNQGGWYYQSLTLDSLSASDTMANMVIGA